MSNVFRALVFSSYENTIITYFHKLWRRNSISTLQKKVSECLKWYKRQGGGVGFKIEVLTGADSLCTCNTLHT